MMIDEFYTKIEEIERNVSVFEIHVSPDFQCDQTGGFPTSLCVSMEQGKAWLRLNEGMMEEGQDVSAYEQLCADYGIRSCWNTEQFNALLEGLGQDACDNAYLMNEDESEGMQL